MDQAPLRLQGMPVSSDTTSVPGVTGLGGYVTATRLNIQTLQQSAIETNGGLDPLFSPGNITNGEVDATILQPDGKLLIGGHFTKVNGVTRQSVARLNPDGTLDTSFDPGAKRIGAEELENDREPFAEKYPRLLAELEECLREEERLTALLRERLRSAIDDT